MLAEYKVSVVPRGYAIIIVNKFENGKDLKRDGADQEIANLENMFGTLGLIPKVHTEFTKQEILQTLDDYSKRIELEEQSMIAIAISSHGGKDGAYGIDVAGKNSHDSEGQKACAITAKEIREIFNSHNCPQLKDKPKLLFLNACRGGKEEEVYKVDGIIDDCDFLTVHSCVSGHVSMRDPVKGSVFIDVLCDTLLEYNGHDVTQLIPVVNSALMKKSSRVKNINGVNVRLTETCTAEPNLAKKLCLPKPPPCTV